MDVVAASAKSIRVANASAPIARGVTPERPGCFAVMPDRAKASRPSSAGGKAVDLFPVFCGRDVHPVMKKGKAIARAVQARIILVGLKAIKAVFSIALEPVLLIYCFLCVEGIEVSLQSCLFIFDFTLLISVNSAGSGKGPI